MTYEEWYRKKPKWWQVKNFLRWRLGNLKAALFGGMSPGEKFLVDMLQREDHEAEVQRTARTSGVTVPDVPTGSLRVETLKGSDERLKMPEHLAKWPNLNIEDAEIIDE